MNQKAKLIIIAAIAVMFIGTTVACSSTDTNTSNTTSTDEGAETEKSQKETVKYEIVEEKDISYAGCKRVGIHIIVPDDSDKEKVKNTTEEIVENKKSEWQDITIWVLKDSEKDQIGKIAATMGIEEYSECK